MSKRPNKLFLPLKDGAGCSSKIPPSIVHQLLSRAELQAPGSFVAAQDQDDAAAIPQADGSWLILTADNSMLTGDTAFRCGMIAALNAMSDVWAMGGKPKYLAGTLVRSPWLKEDDIVEVLRGADAAIGAAGAYYVTGQMNQLISDAPSWLGFSAVGYVEKGLPLMRKANLREGQSLILTKSIGTGLVLMAYQDGLSSDYEVDKIIDSMCISNERASAILSSAGVDACTDISGAGLGGSLAEMVAASRVAVTLNFEGIPLFPGTLEAAQLQSARPALNLGNEDWGHELAKWVFRGERLLSAKILFDPQTSGGLLAGVDSSKLECIVEQLTAQGIPFAVIGRVEAGEVEIRVI
jgi:selenide,water dikinase